MLATSGEAHRRLRDQRFSAPGGDKDSEALPAPVVQSLVSPRQLEACGKCEISGSVTNMPDPKLYCNKVIGVRDAHPTLRPKVLEMT